MVKGRFQKNTYAKSIISETKLELNTLCTANNYAIDYNRKMTYASNWMNKNEKKYINRIKFCTQ